MLRISSAVSHLHAHNIVHQDLHWVRLRSYARVMHLILTLQNNIIIDLEGQIRLLDVGMSPIHSNDQPIENLAHQAQLYKYFTPPELPSEPEQLAHVMVEPSADVFAMGILFLFLLLPITAEGEPSPEFCYLAQQIHDGRSPDLLDYILIRQPADLIRMLWSLIQSMVAIPSRRPDSASVGLQLAPVEAFLRASTSECSY